MNLVNEVANLEAETIAIIDGIVMSADKNGEALNQRLVAIAKTQLELGFAMLSKAAAIVDQNKSN